MNKVPLTWSTTVLCVDNVAKSLEHYRDVLGFDISWQWGDDAFEGNSKPTFACVCRGEVSLFLCEQGQGNPGTWICMSVKSREEFDSLYDEYKSSGADIKSDPEDCPWGMREFQVCDLDGNTFRMGCVIDEDCD